MPASEKLPDRVPPHRGSGSSCFSLGITLRDDVGQTEGDVRENHRGVALRNAQRDEEQEERDTDDDVAVQYRNVVDETGWHFLHTGSADCRFRWRCRVPKRVDTVAVIRAMVIVLTSAAVSEWWVPSTKRFL